MTEEQRKECNFADDLDSDILDAALCTNHYHRTGVPIVTYNLVVWCIKNHFDYRDLIPKGLANDATGLNIYIDMTEHILVEILGNFVRYTCQNCGAVIEIHEHTKDMFIENDVPYFCEDCGEPIKFK